MSQSSKESGDGLESTIASDPGQTPPPPMSRRAFAKAASALAVVPLAAPVTSAPWRTGGRTNEGPLAPVSRDAVLRGGLPAGPPQEQEEEPVGTDALLEYVRELYGERLSDPDVDVVRDGIAGFLRSAESIGEVSLANSDEPALRFRVVGSAPAAARDAATPTGSSAALPSAGPGSAGSADGDRASVTSPETLYGTVASLGGRLRAGEFTAVELTEAYLARLEELGPRLNAVVTVTRERALEAAERADRELAAGRDRGPLHGIPYGAKDLIAVRGYPTTWGAAPYREQEFDEDATIIRRLDAAGAVLIAKLGSVELAGGMGYEQANASFTGPGLNPWNLAAWSGGSSSGPGSAVGAGLVGFAIGTETWGSIVTPSAFCGVSGLRPTYGRVSRDGAMALSWSMDKIGPMCRSAEDCWLVLGVIAGADPADPTTVDTDLFASASVSDGRLVAPSRPRLAMLKGSGETEQEGVRDSFNRSLELLRSYADVEEIELPDQPYSAVASSIIRAEASSAFEGLVASGDLAELTAPEDRIKPYSGQVILAKDYIDALRVRAKIQRALDEALEPYDAVVGPTRLTVANPIEASFPDYFGAYSGPSIGGASNASGLPGITVPNGFGERGLPTALQFTGRAWTEPTILALATDYQQRTDWHERHPEL